jgi:hypothetical protein
MWIQVGRCFCTFFFYWRCSLVCYCPSLVPILRISPQISKAHYFLPSSTEFINLRAGLPIRPVPSVLWNVVFQQGLCYCVLQRCPILLDIFAVVSFIFLEINLYTSFIIQGDQKVSVHLMITIQKVTGNVQSVPRQSSDIY